MHPRVVGRVETASILVSLLVSIFSAVVASQAMASVYAAILCHKPLYGSQLIHSPFLCRCHGEGLGSIEVVVPRDGADGHGGGGCCGNVESSALGGICVGVARCGGGALHPATAHSSATQLKLRQSSCMIKWKAMNALHRLRAATIAPISTTAITWGTGPYLRKVHGAISCPGDGARRAQARPGKHRGQPLLGFGGCRGEVVGIGFGCQCLVVEGQYCSSR